MRITDVGVAAPLESTVSRPRPGDDLPPIADVARRAVAEVFGPIGERSFAVRYWTGATDPCPAGTTPRFTLIVRHAGALRRMFWPPSELGVAEAFIRGDVDVEGDLEGAVAVGRQMAARFGSPGRIARLAALLLRLPAHAPEDAVRPRAAIGRPEWFGTNGFGIGSRHRPSRDAAAVRHHYDVGNEFYRLWLDERQVYSCAYFNHADVSLDAAQWAKLDLVCRKLRLRPGERLLDVGCGWGALICHAAQHYGVTAIGITLSPAQAVLARQRIRQCGVDDRCHVELLDYRSIATLGAFDKIASVGMVEHVGAARLPTYFDALFRALRPGGLLLNHGIVSLLRARPATAGQRLRRWMWRSGAFMDRYIFPDGELVTVGETARQAEAAGFEVRDVENLRPHYTLTLRQWLRRLDARRAEAVALVGAARYRAWRLYLAGSAQAFDSGWLGIIQTLATRPAPDGGSALPLTRHDLYCPA